MYKIWLSAALFLVCFPSVALEIIDQPQTEKETFVFAEKKQLQKTTLSETLKTADVADINNLLDEGLNLNAHNKQGYTPFYYVLKNNPNLEVIERLIAAGADVNAPMKDGTTPLIIVTSLMKKLRQQKQQLETSQIKLISAFPQQEIDTYITEQKEYIINLLNLLIKNGADVNQETPFGTPLMNASTDLWNIPLVEILLQAGAAVNGQDQNGQTALFYARAHGCDDIETLLIKAGANIDITDRYGRLYMDIEPNIE